MKNNNKEPYVPITEDQADNELLEAYEAQLAEKKKAAAQPQIIMGPAQSQQQPQQQRQAPAQQPAQRQAAPRSGSNPQVIMGPAQMQQAQTRQNAAAQPPHTPGNPQPPQSEEPLYKKWWFWLIIGVVVVAIIVAIVIGVSSKGKDKTSSKASTSVSTSASTTAQSSTKKSSTQQSTQSSSSTQQSTKQTTSQKQTTTGEDEDDKQARYSHALVEAKELKNEEHCSRQMIYNRLESGGTKQDAIEYALDNIGSDYKGNARIKANEYAAEGNDRDAIENILINNDLFTEEEAEYAVKIFN